MSTSQERDFAQAPAPSAVSVPTRTAPANRSTVEFAGAVPVNDGVVSDVMLSVLEGPVSLPAMRSGAEGAAGTLVLISIERAPEAGEGPLPAASVWMAVIEWTPADSALLVIVQVVPLATAVPTTTASDSN